ncbi:hypothetical protein ABTZ58_39190 [Streptomyces sp. NPDC094143]|uniref:hypothetical protein n=1 Tax=Streptomyces sp. NPDC094143 TaxID=3155310 RepID=UPI00331F84B7
MIPVGHGAAAKLSTVDGKSTGQTALVTGDIARIGSPSTRRALSLDDWLFEAQ